jgi:hypothetical protein
MNILAQMPVVSRQESLSKIIRNHVLKFKILYMICALILLLLLLFLMYRRLQYSRLKARKFQAALDFFGLKDPYTPEELMQAVVKKEKEAKKKRKKILQ